jgi:hypothetical protein
VTIIFPNLGMAGRLGNQLWQIASTIGIAEKQRDEPRFPEWDYRPYFCIPDSYFGAQIGIDATKFVSHIDPRAQVYLQDYNLFSHVKDEIRCFFQPSELAWEIMMSDENRWVLELPQPVTVLHVRRGDNVIHPQGFHPLRSNDYYENALSFTSSKSSVLVLSDDIPWCRANIPSLAGSRDTYFYEGVARPREYADRVAYQNSPAMDWLDMQLGAHVAQNVIMSNSSYSWWMAFLSNPSASVCYPTNFFGRELSYIDASLMFPPGWICLQDPTQGGV